MPLDLAPLLARLDARHRAALEWFRQRQGEIIGWPGTLADGTRLVSLGKAIYKPAGSPYALSVRQNLGSPYPDREPVVRPDGSWVYEYSPEVDPAGDSDALFTNASLRACQADHVPVAVMRELPEQPGKYRVHGLAVVARRTPQHFILEGFAPSGQTAAEPSIVQEEGVVQAAAEAEQAGAFDPEDAEDARRRVQRVIAQRRGQQRFRSQLIKAYAGKCAMTGCADLSVLEAAHIMPYRGDATDHVQNGLLLRADVHTLFDLGLVTIHPEHLTVHVAPTLLSAEYRSLEGQPLHAPAAAKDRPSSKALAARWAEIEWIASS